MIMPCLSVVLLIQTLMSKEGAMTLGITTLRISTLNIISLNITKFSQSIMSLAIFVIMLNVIMVGVVIPTVVAPKKRHCKKVFFVKEIRLLSKQTREAFTIRLFSVVANCIAFI
jgi:hypothetical protein